MNVKAKTLNEITEEQFKAYERVRRSGSYNMIADHENAAWDAGLEDDAYLGILKNYTALAKKFPGVRDRERT